MHGPHDIDHEPAEHKSLSCILDLAPMVLRQLTAAPGDNDAIVALPTPARKTLNHYHRELREDSPHACVVAEQ